MIEVHEIRHIVPVLFSCEKADMNYLRNAIYTSLRTAPRTIGKLFKSRKPQEGDEAAQRLTSRIMDVLDGYEIQQKATNSGGMPVDAQRQDGSAEN